MDDSFSVCYRSCILTLKEKFKTPNIVKRKTYNKEDTIQSLTVGTFKTKRSKRSGLKR